MCTRMQNDMLCVLCLLRGPVFQFVTCLWRHVLGVLGVVCVLLGLCVLSAFSNTYAEHCWLQKRASGQRRTDGRQRNNRSQTPGHTYCRFA